MINGPCRNPEYLNTPFLIIYLNGTETLICHIEFSLLGSTSFGFAQDTIQDFQSTILNSLWHGLQQMQQKLAVKGEILFDQGKLKLAYTEIIFLSN